MNLQLQNVGGNENVVKHTLLLLGSERSDKFERKYGLRSAPGKLIFLENDDVFINVILQEPEPNAVEYVSDCRSEFVHTPFLTTIVDSRSVRVLPYYEETLESYVKRNIKSIVYPVVEEKPRTDLNQLLTFSEQFKARLLEFFKGIRDIHASGNIHGSIGGTTMVLVRRDSMRTLMGRVFGISSTISVDPREDWKAVAKFLEGLITRNERLRGHKFDSEIEDLIDLLKDNNVTDELVVEHISLWLPARKREFINKMQDNIFAQTIKLNHEDLLGTDEHGNLFKWKFKVELNIKSYIIDKGDYTGEMKDLIRFLRNIVEHGMKELQLIHEHLQLKFDYDEKGIWGMIDKAFPKLLVNLLKEAKKAQCYIPSP